MSFREVWHHRMKYMLTPQLDLYRHVSTFVACCREGRRLSILDYGCGNGFGALQLVYPATRCYVQGDAKGLPTRNVLGMDSDRAAIDFAYNVLGHLVDFSHEDWHNLTLPSEEDAYDVITCIEVIEHCQHPEWLLRSFRQVLKPDGIFVCSTLNHRSQYRKNDDHVSRFTVLDFRQRITEHFPGARITDYTLQGKLGDDSTVTPIVAVWAGA